MLTFTSQPCRNSKTFSVKLLEKERDEKLKTEKSREEEKEKQQAVDAAKCAEEAFNQKLEEMVEKKIAEAINAPDETVEAKEDEPKKSWFQWFFK